MTDRDRKKGTRDILEHMPLEEVKIEDIHHIGPPPEWDPEVHEKEPHVPPVLIEETTWKNGGDGFETAPRKYTILAQHRSFWRMLSRGHLSIRALVVRSGVHISLAHESIDNCIEEALLFEGLLRNELVENRSRLSDLLGYSRARITQILNLLKLPPQMRGKLLLTDGVSEFQLRPLIRVSDEAQQEEMFAKLIEGKLTGRQMALFASGVGSAADGQEAADETEPPGGTLVELEEMLTTSETREPSGDANGTVQGAGTSSHTGLRAPSRSSEDFDELLQKVGSLNDGDWELRARSLGVPELSIILLRGISLLRSGLYSEAIEMLEAVIENDQDLAPAYFYLGRCANLTGALTAAESHLRTALQLVPDHPDYLVELAIVLEKLKRNAEASTHYRRAGALRKKLPEAPEK